MKFSKIVLAVLLILAVTATLFACSPSGGETGGTPGGETGGVTPDDGSGNTPGGGDNTPGGGENTPGGNTPQEPELTGDFKILYQRTSSHKCSIIGFEGKGEGAVVVPSSYTIDGEECVVVSIAAGAFRGCKYITSLVIPETVESIGLGALEGCVALEELTVPFVGGSATSDTFIGYVFGGDTFSANADVVPATLGTVTVTGAAAEVDDDGVEKKAAVSSIASFAFDSCSSIHTVNIGSHIKTIGAYAFARCSINKIQLPAQISEVGIGAYVGCPVEEAILPFVGKDSSGTFGHIGYIFGASEYTKNADFVPSTLKTVTISEGCELIGLGAFHDCTALETIEIPSTIVNIGGYAFTNTPFFLAMPDGLVYIDRVLYTYKGELGNNTDIVIADGTTAIAGNAFAGLPITSVSIPQSVVSIGAGAFEGSKLTELTLPFIGENASAATNQYLGYIFGASAAADNGKYVPTTLKKVSLYDTCTAIGDSAFYGCTSLTTVEIGSGVSSISKNAFFDCTTLKDITISAQNTTYQNHSGLVYNMAGDDLVAVPMAVTGDIQLLNITSIADGQFRNCVGITSVVLPATLESIGKEAFAGIQNLTTINFPEALVAVGLGAFDNTAWYANQADGVVYTGNVLYKFKGESGERVTIPNNVTGIAAGAFANCNLVSVEIPSSVTNIGEGAFTGCQLESITLPFIGADSTGTNNPFLGYLFGASSAVASSAYVPTTLKSVTLLDSCTSIGANAFDGCTSVEELVIPQTVTSIAGEALHQTAWFANQEPGVVYVGKIAYSFVSPKKTSAEYEEEIKNQPADAETPIVNPYEVVLRADTIAIAAKAFQNAGIVSIRIPNTVTYIGDYAFSMCRSLASVRMPDTLEYLGAYSFNNCTAIRNIYVPTGINVISKSTFNRCTALYTVTIGAGIHTVEDGAFAGCTILMNVNYLCDYDYYMEIDFTTNNDKLTKAQNVTYGDEYKNESFEIVEEDEE